MRAARCSLGGVFKAANPNVVIRFGVGPNVGTGPLFSGAVDRMVVGFGGNDTVFDFEATSTSAVIGSPEYQPLPDADHRVDQPRRQQHGRGR